jgi:hypothetical protein
MTEPNPGHPVPGPPRPGPSDGGPPAAAESEEERFADLEQRPVAEHVAVFEAEHDRLQRELGTIDQV